VVPENLDRDIEIAPDDRSNRLMLIGAPQEVAEVRELIASLDEPLGLETKTYQFSNVRAEKIDRLARALFVPEDVDRLYRSMIDDSENVMVVTAPQSVHDQIEQLRQARDVPLKVPGESRQVLQNQERGSSGTDANIAGY
jgi:type II secretory pathway component GspD/PulD (secretin)